MEQNDVKKSISNILSKLPRKMIEHKHNDVITECLLYELSHEICFHLSSIAYFVYNPDFHICKGVAGILEADIKDWCKDPWHDIETFEKTIKNKDYNKKIKSTEFCTLFAKSNLDIVNEIKKSIEINDINYYCWNLHNNNIGILVYKEKNSNPIEKEHIEDAAGIIGFCPIH